MAKTAVGIAIFSLTLSVLASGSGAQEAYRTERVPDAQSYGRSNGGLEAYVDASQEPSAYVDVRYVDQKRVNEDISAPNQPPRRVHRLVQETKHVRIPVTADLDSLDLPADGKRAAVLAVTAARHDGLLKKLKEAKTEDEKDAATEALTDNYTRHYAIETWWRQQKLVELEKKLTDLREQVEQRQGSQERYVTAAMTIAQLWADGIAITPPKPRRISDPGGPYVPVRPILPVDPPGPAVSPPSLDSLTPPIPAAPAPRVRPPSVEPLSAEPPRF